MLYQIFTSTFLFVIAELASGYGMPLPLHHQPAQATELVAVSTLVTSISLAQAAQEDPIVPPPSPSAQEDPIVPTNHHPTGR